MPRGQDAEHLLACHRRLHDGLLQGAAVGVRRLRAEIVEAEPAPHLLAGVVPLPAPAAGGIGAVRVPQPMHEAPGLGKLVAHPGRHDRIAAGDRQPGQRVGQRPAKVPGFRHGLAAVGCAGCALQPLADRRMELGLHGPGRAAKRREEVIEGAVHAIWIGCGQPVPRGQ